MAILTIPVDPTRLFVPQYTTLDKVVYLLTFNYNSRESVYYLTIQSSDGKVTYAQGIKLVTGIFLLSNYGNNPPGELFIVSQNTKNDAPPAFGELGEALRCVLLYWDSTELAAAKADPNRFPGFLVT
jgi:hypothetical protein